MARQRTAFRSFKPIAAATLAGFAMFLLYENLGGAVAWLSHVFGADSCHASGVLSTVMVAISQAFDPHAANHHCLLQGFLQQMLVSSWPLLVMAGTLLSPDTRTDKVNALRKEER